MKIFDFSDGKKGKFLANVKRPSYFSGGHQELSIGRYEYHLEATGDNHAWGLDPYDYDVEAICFCVGEMQAGTSASEWWWVYVADLDVAQQLKARVEK